MADDRLIEAVKFLDLGDGAGWELLQVHESLSVTFIFLAFSVILYLTDGRFNLMHLTFLYLLHSTNFLNYFAFIPSIFYFQVNVYRLPKRRFITSITNSSFGNWYKMVGMVMEV